MVVAAANRKSVSRVRPEARAKFRLVESMGMVSVDRFMQRYGLNQNEVAAMLGVSRRSIENWVKDGTPEDRQRTLGLLASHFDNAHQANSLVGHINEFLQAYDGQLFANIRNQSTGIIQTVSAYEYGLRKRGT